MLDAGCLMTDVKMTDVRCLMLKVCLV